MRAPDQASQAAAMALAARKPAANGPTAGKLQTAQAASTNSALVLMRNATPATTPLQKARPRKASHTAARCGASIVRSAASGITADGKSKIKKKPSSPAAQ